MESKKTVKQLRTIARERGLKKYDLIEFIEGGVEAEKPNEVDLIEFNDEGVESQNQGKKFSELEYKTLKQLQTIARERGMKGYSRLKKADLIEFITNPTNEKSLNELRFLAKEKKIKRYYLMRKSELLVALEAVEKQEPIKSPKRKQKQCIHNKSKYSCKECEGSRYCKHGRIEYYCKECGGNGICIHWNNKHYCKECGGGSGLCMHGKNKYFCKDCSGKGICTHGKNKYRCKVCRGEEEKHQPVCESVNKDED